MTLRTPPTGPDQAGPEDRLSDHHYAALAMEIETRTGIRLPGSKQAMAEGRLTRRARALGLPNVRAYGAYLFDAHHLNEELAHVIDAITTNKTDFFREPSHFAFLRDQAVPALLRLHDGRAPRLKVWSAACSIGAEAYSAAMVLQDLAGPEPAFRFAVLGTDIATKVLEEARTAIYPADFTSPVPPDMRRRYLMHGRDRGMDLVRIVPELRRCVMFERLNLMDASYPVDRDVDIIFCRNVLIYFDRDTQNAVVMRLLSHLRPGGYLLLGHSESMAGPGSAGVKMIEPTIYQTAPAAKGRKAA